MDGRQRLAHPSIPKPARRAPVAIAWPLAYGRWRRLAQRWLAPLLALDPPRGLGASAAALLLLASTCYGVVKGGHAETIATEIHDICDAAANAAGFRISEVALTGQHQVSRETILALAGITGRSSLPFLNAARTRTRLLNDPWIKNASVLKLYPGRLRIAIKERKAFALWQKDGLVSLIATDGTVLETYAPTRFLSLPLLVGSGAEHAGRAFLTLLARHPAIARQVESSVLVADRRWSLHLKNGVEVLLPENDPGRALTILADLDRDKKLLSRDIVAVDLRLADRVTVRLSDAAAAARNEALKAAEQKRKAKGKGGEA